MTLIPAWEFATMEESGDTFLEYNYVNAITGDRALTKPREKRF